MTDLTLANTVSPVWNEEASVWTISETDVQKRFNNYYWSAPNQYVGNKLTSYGLVLRVSISWNVLRGDTNGKPVFNPDIIIVVGFFSYVCVCLFYCCEERLSQ